MAITESIGKIFFGFCCIESHNVVLPSHVLSHCGVLRQVEIASPVKTLNVRWLVIFLVQADYLSWVYLLN